MFQISASTLRSAADQCEAATRLYLREEDTESCLAFQRAMSFPIALMRAAASRAVSASEPVGGVPPGEGLDETDFDLLQMQCRVASRTCRSHGFDPIVLGIAVVLDRVADSCDASLGDKSRAASP